MGVEVLHVALRTLANRWLIDTCTILRATDGASTGDGNPATWPTLATDVPCSLQPYDAAPTENVGPGGGIMSLGNWRIRLPYGQDVTARDRIVIGARTFEVQGVLARTFEVRRSALCVEIT